MMSKIEIITLLLSSAVVSGVVTTALTYYLDIRKNKDERLFRLKQDAYMRAIDAISEMSETVFDYIIKKHSIEKKVNPITVIEFNAAHMRRIAPAMLVASNEIGSLFKEIPKLIIECAETIEALTKSTERTEKGFLINPKSQEAENLRLWKERAQKLENQVIKAMQNDLGISG